MPENAEIKFTRENKLAAIDEDLDTALAGLAETNERIDTILSEPDDRAEDSATAEGTGPEAEEE